MISQIAARIAGWFGLTTLNPLTLIEIRGEEMGRDLAQQEHSQELKVMMSEIQALERAKTNLVYSLERMETREDNLKEDLYALKRHIQELEFWVSSNKFEKRRGVNRKPTLPERYWK